MWWKKMNSKSVLNIEGGNDIKKYYVCDAEGNELFSCEDLIECHDFSGIGYHYLFAFSGVSNDNLGGLVNGQFVTLKSSLFSGRLDVAFTVKKIFKKKNGLFYFYIEDLRQGAYEFGTLAFLQLHENDPGRIWLGMKGDSKRIYLSASYLLNGESYSLNKETVIIEGKYIHDYYSFFCEFGYALFGDFGFAGNSIYSLEDFLNGISKKDLTWKDSDISLKAIDNTIPSGYRGRSSYDLLAVLEENFNLKLQ
ncbi:hypothetical protein ACI09F_003200 [Cronobacter turicensis]